jgi:hypothetical protein
MPLAKLLLRDAVLLNDNERDASAFALAGLGLEEIGEALKPGLAG